MKNGETPTFGQKAAKVAKEEWRAVEMFQPLSERNGRRSKATLRPE